MSQITGQIARLTTQSKAEVVLPLTKHWVDEWNLDLTLRKIRLLKASVKGDIKAPRKFQQLESDIAEYEPEKTPPGKSSSPKKTPANKVQFFKPSLRQSSLPPQGRSYIRFEQEISQYKPPR